MGRFALILGAVLTLAGIVGIVTEAWAACPPGTRYSCSQGFNGKVICGCN